MMATIWPGSVGARRRRGDMGVDVADRDGDAAGRPVQRGRLGGEPACALAELADLAGRASPSTKSANAGLSAARKSRSG